MLLLVVHPVLPVLSPAALPSVGWPATNCLSGEPLGGSWRWPPGRCLSEEATPQECPPVGEKKGDWVFGIVVLKKQATIDVLSAGQGVCLY